jgi:hypothetical protein
METGESAVASEGAPAGPTGGGALRKSMGWAFLLAGIGYTTYAYYGLAPPPGGLPTDWWHGHTFMLDWPVVGGWVDAPTYGSLMLSLPAILCCVGVFFGTRSALARTLSLACAFSVFFFAACAFRAPEGWEFFSWRLTAIFVLSGLSLSAAILSPLLVKSWLRLPVWLQVLIYAPLFVLLMAVVRGATGTDEEMAFLVSPWPAWTVFALERGVILICGFLLASGIGVISLSGGFKKDVRVAAGTLAALALPGSWIAIFSDTPSVGGFFTLAAATAALLGLGLISGAPDRRRALGRRGLHLVLGAVMAFVPIFTGQRLAASDKEANLHVLAPQLTEALQKHIEKEESYPSDLAALVPEYLDEYPRPRIGFALVGWLGLESPAAYRYNEYGSSYVLEFDGPLWTQCAYSGQYYFEEEEEDYEDEEGYFDEEPSWSCPEKTPPLFSSAAGNEEERIEDFEDEDDRE